MMNKEMNANLLKRAPVCGSNQFVTRQALLQRKCACGGVSVLSHECAECRQKRLTGQPALIQPKLTINQPGDPYEREADRVVETVMRMPMLGIQRQSVPENEEEEEEELQAKPASAQTPQISPTLATDIRSLRGGGRPLDPATRSFMEPRFGHDFSQVRIHTDNKATRMAHSVNARAFTLGQDVVFGSGQYSPKSGNGQRLLAHELTHVVQQSSRSVEKNIRRKVVDDNAHVPCRGTRADAVTTLQTAEADAIRLAERAAAHIRTHLILHPLISITGETSSLRNFRDLLWRRFHFDYNDTTVRETLLPLWARRFELVAGWIRRLNHKYVCGAPGSEPPGECTDQPGVGNAWTATGINQTELCDGFWGRSSDDLAETILHEWFHFGFDWLGDCEQSHNRNNTKCWDMFAAELSGTATPTDYRTCCPPPSTPLPPLVGVP